ncbi:hypothetical protein FGO68_gene5679 [Halteria grandinella]|uniref:Uncharacterized protein n=1 Tax=Halteria grandinella TaxID=5974 RepID=A0A8J8P119_HALGN|nr:hypothetical protein FGO68_gene5679 [Halteria grandinella]
MPYLIFNNLRLHIQGTISWITKSSQFYLLLIRRYSRYSENIPLQRCPQIFRIFQREFYNTDVFSSSIICGISLCTFSLIQ